MCSVILAWTVSVTTTIAQEAPSVSFEKEQWEGHLGTIYSPSANKTIGSGFVFGSHKDVITCAHVVAGGYFLCKDTNLVFFSQQALGRSLKLKYILPRYDLAVLSPTPEIAGKPLKAGDFKKMRPGDQIIYIGYDQRRSSSTNVTSIASHAVVTATGSALNEGTTIDFLEFEDGEGKEEPPTAAGVHTRKGLRWSCIGGIVPP
jgi:hypothetical protein